VSLTRPIAASWPSPLAGPRLVGPEPAAPDERAVSESLPIVRDPRMVELYRMAQRVARHAVSVVVLGETGVGKELLVEALHRQSGRKGTLAVVNCGAIPASLTESALFGHERGAFTGAECRRPGLFEQADGGTLFLDEVGELGPGAQAALLRVLEEGCFQRVGGRAPVKVDVRVVAATHRNLPAMIAAGTFRQDLWYRINTFVLEIPPLRERPMEIEPLARAFLAAAARRFGGPERHFSADALAAMRGYAWPGNVRELRYAVDQAVLMAEGPVIGVADLPRTLRTVRRG
jgi:DNA-binding NtrC family response regulator